MLIYCEYCKKETIHSGDERSGWVCVECGFLSRDPLENGNAISEIPKDN